MATKFEANSFTSEFKTTVQEMAENIGSRLSSEMELRIDAERRVMNERVNGIDRELNAKLDDKPGHGALLAHTLSIIGLLGGLFLALLAFGGERFSGGMSAGTAFNDTLRQISNRMDKIDDTLMELKNENAKGSERESQNSPVHKIGEH